MGVFKFIEGEIIIFDYDPIEETLECSKKGTNESYTLEVKIDDN